MDRPPGSHGFRMPAEWELHDGCWIGWPERRDNWANNAGPAQQAFAEVATAISRFESVTVCASATQWENARTALPSHVRVVEMSTNDSWFRDTGPTLVVKDEEDADGSTKRSVVGVDWAFNGWGELTEFNLDCAVARKILEIEKIPRFSNPIIMEGGSFHVDGEGTLITTEECLLHKNRNPDKSKEEIEEQLRLSLGVTHIIWLPRGLFADTDTNGHVDNIACFAKPGVVLLAWEEDPEDPQHEISKEAYDVLSKAVDARGRTLEVIKVQPPRPMYYTEEDVEALEDGFRKSELAEALKSGDQNGTRMAGSYINFYLANGAVIMPAFGDKERDEAAVKVMQETFPGREVVTIASSCAILRGGGNIHCITQQQPARRPAAPPGSGGGPAANKRHSSRALQFLDPSPALANTNTEAWHLRPGAEIDLNEEVEVGDQGQASDRLGFYKHMTLAGQAPQERKSEKRGGGALLDLNADFDPSMGTGHDTLSLGLSHERDPHPNNNGGNNGSGLKRPRESEEEY